MEGLALVAIGAIALILAVRKTAAAASDIAKAPADLYGPPNPSAGAPAPSSSPDASRPTALPIGPPTPDATGWSKADILTLIPEISEEVGYGRPELVRAIAIKESSLNPNAINTTDRPPSVGLMGLKVPTARGYVPSVSTEMDLFDPPTNIRAGTLFLKDLERKYLTSYGLDGVIQMYNLGETRFRMGERAPFYLSSVRALLASRS